jgi:hypothetical protein
LRTWLKPAAPVMDDMETNNDLKIPHAPDAVEFIWIPAIIDLRLMKPICTTDFS